MVSVDRPSLTEKLVSFEAGSQAVAAHFVRESAAFATGEGEILIAGESEARVKAHKGAILSAAGDGERIFTAGDDGRIVAVDIEGEQETLVDIGNKWIDQLALGPDGALAWSVGKTAFVRGKKAERSLEAVSTVGGLSPRDRALQRSDALVPEHRRRAREARMEGLASRRDVQPGWTLSCHHHAGTRAARLAAFGRPAHAD